MFFHIRMEDAAGAFQRGKSPNLLLLETHSQKLTAILAHTATKNSRHTASLDELAEPN